MLWSHMDVGVTETPSGILIILLLSRWQRNLPHLPLSIIHILLPIYTGAASQELLQGKHLAPGLPRSSTWGSGRQSDMSLPLPLKLKYANRWAEEFQWVHPRSRFLTVREKNKQRVVFKQGVNGGWGGVVQPGLRRMNNTPGSDVQCMGFFSRVSSMLN